MAKKAKYPNRIYSTKSSAEKASKRYGGKGTKNVSVTREKGRKLKGYGVKW